MTETLREKMARAAALAIAKQDYGHTDMDGDGLNDDLTTNYLDQGQTDFGLVADAILALPELAALKLTIVKPLNLGPSISTGTKKDD